MDDLNRSWAILGLRPGSSREKVRAAYREQVKLWHPDLFQGNQDKLDEAHEMLKELNWANDYLFEHGFTEEPPPAVGVIEAEPESEPPPAEDSRNWAPIIFAVALLAAGAYYFSRPKTKPPVATIQSNAPTTTNVSAPMVAVAPDRNILREFKAANKLEITPSADGLLLKGGDRDFLQAPRALRPPYTFRATVKAGTDLRFYYGLGQIIFNWADNPAELRVHDFSTGDIRAARGKGGLSPNAWHELAVEVRADAMSISVDGENRYEATGFFKNLSTAPGLGPFRGEALVKRIEIDESKGDEPAADAPPVASRIPAPGDLLKTMSPVNAVRMNSTPEGVVLTEGPGHIKTAATFRPPFILKTRAKTDSIDMRLYYAAGVVILNWEGNPSELRVHDPASGQVTGHAGKGRILPNQWHDITWEVYRNGMRVSVDGQPRFQNNKDYSKVEGPAGIGPNASTVTVQSFVVEQK